MFYYVPVDQGSIPKLEITTRGDGLLPHADPCRTLRILVHGNDGLVGDNFQGLCRLDDINLGSTKKFGGLTMFLTSLPRIKGDFMTAHMLK